MKINIVGGSGAGTTTLAEALAEALDMVCLDADAYYWVPTDPPYQRKIPAAERGVRLRRDFDAHARVALAGSMIGSWGEGWAEAFDLVVYLYIPPALRMRRLETRERARFGERLTSDPVIAATSAEFLAWARRYDDPSFEGKSVTRHARWLAQVSCPVLRIEGDTSVAERVARVRALC